jgi:nitrate reductase gamma subunit
MNALNTFLFAIFPYLCLAVFLMGSLARYDRDQYTWKSDSSMLLRKDGMRLASNLFHAGILFLFVGHLFGLLTPQWAYAWLISPESKKVVANVSGGIAGAACFVGLTILLYRRMFDARIRLTSHRTDLAILIILWVQLALGLSTLLLARYPAAEVAEMLALSKYLQSLVIFQPNVELLAGVSLVSKLHMLLGMLIFLLFPFSRLVHVWSGLATLAYVFRPQQLVRSRRMNVPAGQNQPGRAPTAP